MAFASLSIYGLYTYNAEIFDNLVLPSGLDKDILVSDILTECSDFALLYPNYDFMKMLIGVWSQKELLIWTRLHESETIEYNPIENYDRHESISRSVTSEATGESAANSKASTTGSGVSKAGRTAYDSGSMRDVSQSDSMSSDASQGESSETSKNAASGVETVVNHTHGNIGVTTAQQMIEGYREVSKFCVYDYIVQSFKDRFCVQVY